MNRIILTYNDIFEVNQKLEEQNLNFKVHLHDACGSQSFTVEPLSNCACEDHYDEMVKIITDYFDHRGIQIRFSENNLEFMFIA